MTIHPRHALAAARIALRAAEDAEKNMRAIVTMHVTGSNDDARKKAAVIALVEADDYQDALRELRASEAAVDHAQAEVDIANDDLRRAELDARLRLAEALAGKRADDAVSDCAITGHDCAGRTVQRMTRGQTADDVAWQQHAGTYDRPDFSDPIYDE